MAGAFLFWLFPVGAARAHFIAPCALAAVLTGESTRDAESYFRSAVFDPERGLWPAREATIRAISARRDEDDTAGSRFGEHVTGEPASLVEAGPDVVVKVTVSVGDKGASLAAGPGRAQPERREEGIYGTLDYKMRFYQDGREISPWHDIPLKVGEFYNMVTEIPASRLEKMEIVTEERMNPLKQDEKPRGTPRLYPKPGEKPIPRKAWNYGYLPQTWEDPAPEPLGGQTYGGDKDPIDAVEVGGGDLASGSVTPVKVLGALPMVDKGELDWKVVTVRSDDPNADRLRTLEDIGLVYPDAAVEKLHAWFDNYKGAGEVTWAWDWSQHPGPDKAAEAIELTHEQWRTLTDCTSGRNAQLDNKYWAPGHADWPSERCR